MALFLIIVLLIILALPLMVRQVEEQIELFLFIMGMLTVSMTKQWNGHLIKEMLLDPVKITIAVLIAGFIFMFFNELLAKQSSALLKKTGIRTFVFLFVVILGLISSIITAIVAALILTETIKHIKLPRKIEIKLVIITCFSIGMGAALTPIGEPLSTITIAKLQGPPYNADFWFLFRLIWWYTIPVIIALGIVAISLVDENKEVGFEIPKSSNVEKETIKDVILRTGKVYIFIMGLVLLGKGFEPLITNYISKIPHYFLYWINIVSAVLDNATLAAAEIDPSMSLLQIKSAILGLIVAGGMLIPGNIPNIIVSNKLKIKSKEWAVFALPLGLGLMVMYFVIIMVMGTIK
jgi:predicted cation transporter